MTDTIAATAPIALDRYDPVIVSWSGGDDSTACLAYILSQVPASRVKAVWCDTGAEHPETYGYIWRMVDAVLPRDLEVLCVRGETVYGESLEAGIRRRGQWPGAKARYCTKHLKTIPTARLVRRRAWWGGVLVLGQRRAESAHRARLAPFNAVGACGIPTWRPLLDWTKDDVLAQIARQGWPRNPVYAYQTRGGNCMVCIMARPAEIVRTARRHPDQIARWAALEAEIGHTWGSRKGHSIANFLATARSQAFLPRLAPGDLDGEDAAHEGCDSGFCEMG
ncbi:MAG: phosphoadenosine phosphosulfate reductase family protein [Anaerolineae bacterium]|nr:phosphoadenosine phosphosulfate reductase family protein [Anaerolineae bacterium]